MDKSTTDALMRVVKALSSRGLRPAKVGSGFRAFCPIHESPPDGHKPSLVVKPRDDGSIMILCGSRRCDYREILRALEIDPAGLRPVLTLEALAATKKLPVEFLRELGLHDGERTFRRRDGETYQVRGVVIPYRATNGSLLLERLRVRL